MDSLDQSRPLRKRKLSDASEKFLFFWIHSFSTLQLFFFLKKRENSRRSSRIKQKEVRPFEVMEQNSNLSSLLPIVLFLYFSSFLFFYFENKIIEIIQKKNLVPSKRILWKIDNIELVKIKWINIYI